MREGAYRRPRQGVVFKPSTLLWLLLAIAGVVAILPNLHEVSDVLRVVRAGDVAVLPALVLVEALFIVNMGLFYWSTFRATDAKATLSRFIPLSAAGHFVNLVSKSSGFGAMALYLGEGRRQGDSPVRVSLAFLVSYALGYAAFFSVLVCAIAMLYLRGSLTRAELIGAAIILAVILTTSALMIAGLRSQHSLERVYLLLVSPLNFVAKIARRHQVIDLARARETTTELFEAVSLMKSRPRRLVAPFVFALGIELLGVVFLYLVGVSLHADISPATAVEGYALALMFSILSVTPGGLGFVEASLAIFLVSTGLSRQQALAVTIGYRLFDFWLPILIGAISLVLIKSGSRRDESVVDA